MIGFFRRIRKKLADDNQFLKYSRYAIGEIVLVMVGILLALQVNNWNENRKAKNRAIEYHNRLLEDLDRTLETGTRINDIANKVINAINQSVYLLEQKKELSEKDRELVDYTFIWASRFNYQFSELSTYKEMQSNGDLRLIYNVELRDQLVNFQDYLVSVDAIFNRLGAAIVNNQAFLDKYLRSHVDPETLIITNRYNFLDMANDEEFINELSRITIHWRGNAFFTNQIRNRVQNLKELIESDLEKLR